MEAAGDEPEFQRFIGLDLTTEEPLWSLHLVDEHLKYAPLIQLYAGDPDTSEPSVISDPQALRGLAAVLMAQRGLSRSRRRGSTNAQAARDDVNTLIEAWEARNGDSWDLAAGLIAAHEVVTPRLAMMAQDVTAALDGDETMQDVWCIPPATNTFREEDLADSLGVLTRELRTRLAAWAGLEP
ncbi:hypothetical protein [Terrabacter terrae]|uniref:hypothetical protein n=1 Tax=Terrabacter terrae TaxID=318434 RepID=UPI0031CE0D5B